MNTVALRSRPSSSSPSSSRPSRARALGLGLFLAAALATSAAPAAPVPAATVPTATVPAATAPVAEAGSAAPTLSVPALREAAERHLERGEVGEAVLAYERAAWLAPRDESVERGLAAARAAAGVAVDGPSSLERAAGVLAVHEATHLAAIAAWVAVFAAIAWATSRRRRALFAGAAAGALVVSAAAAASIAARAEAIDAAIALDDATLGIAPFTGSEPVTPLSEGAKVEVHGRHGTFVRVRTATGAMGWVDESELAPVIL